MSNVRGRLGRLERDAAVAAVRYGPRTNIFDELLALVVGEITLDDAHPDDRPFLEQLYCAMVPDAPASASPQGSHEVGGHT